MTTTPAERTAGVTTTRSTMKSASRLLAAVSAGAGAASAVGVCCVAGFVFGVLVVPLHRNRNFPWIVARATGVGAFVALGALTVVGLFFRRRSRTRTIVHPETMLRIHAGLAAAVVVLIATHIGSLLADKYSGVNWKSLVVPNAATHRPGAVTYGMFAALMIVLLVVTAAAAGRWGVGARWALVHRLALPAFVLVWLHGVLVGSDTAILRGLYIAEGLAVGIAAIPLLARNSGWRRTQATP